MATKKILKKTSILHRVSAIVKAAKTLKEAKTATIECIDASKIPNECKIQMKEDIEKQKTLKGFIFWFYNAILAFEDCRIIK
jgi:hypothetical protein